MKDKDYKIPKVLAVVLYTGNKKWNPKRIKRYRRKARKLYRTPRSV